MVLGLGWVGASSPGQAALLFNFTAAGGTDPLAIAGFQAAGVRWSSIFNDHATVNITIAFTNLGAGILGSTGTAQANYGYGAVRTALTADQTSATDAIAVANLPASSISMVINRTSDNPNGSGSSAPALDNNGSANNTQIRMTNANAKALGLLAGNNAALDASISFSNAITWDFDPTNGVVAGAYDFVGAATHEIGHALGFFSGVDILDTNSPPVNGPFPSNAFTFVSTLDLFRYSALSGANNAIDWTADTRTKYFSIDRGTTVGPAFATGANFGDGNQASHWKDALGLGIMDPAAATGELLAISANDVRAFDAIGWNPVPDAPSSLALLGIGLAVLGSLHRRMKISSASVGGRV